jgi:hypothetical protein
MKTLKYVSLMFIAFVFIMSCSGNHGNLKTQSEDDSRATQQELISNWSDFNIWLNYSRAPGLNLIVFDPKNDHRKILVDSNWDTVMDQETWTEIVKANRTTDGDFNMVWAGYDYSTTRVQEIWGPDNLLYGYIIHQKIVVDSVNVKQVDENTMQLSWRRTPNGGTH